MKRTPIRRPLRVFAYDPSLATELENFDVSEVSVDVRWENDLRPGPVGEYLEVVDIDPASGCAYAPVDLNDPTLLAEAGLAPSEGNPQFHQQMTYAVAMSTIQHFERALGRSILWSDQRLVNKRPQKDDFAYTDKLRIYPHALRENNAYYDPSKKALLFGYFPSQPAEIGLDMPGGLVFSSLSHDIIAHETTHAILDGVQPYFLEPTNVDVLAFHEAFADIVALFEHFTYPEILRRQIARARGDLTSTETLLGQLAMQFGKATGGRSALRDAIGKVDASGKWRRRDPDPLAYQTTTEPHARGALFVAAVFDVFLAIYRHRTRDLLRIATGGTGVLPDGDLHPDLVCRLADEAAKTAQHMLTICIRAIDYCPPVDITFGDYVRALVTADVDVMPVDKRNYRVAIIESFRRWGIYPENVRTLSVESLVWNAPDDQRHAEALTAFVDSLQSVFDDTIARPEDEIKRAWSDLRNGTVTSDKGSDIPRKRLSREQIWQRTRTLAARVHNAIADLTQKIEPEKLNSLFGLEFGYGHDESKKFRIATVRPVRRPSWDGRTKDDVLLQIVQGQDVVLDPEFEKTLGDPNQRQDASAVARRQNRFKFRGGATFIIDLETRAIRYAITKSIFSQRRLQRQREFLLGVNETNERALYFGQTPDSQQLAALHVCHHS